MNTLPGFPEEHLRALGAHLKAASLEVRMLVVGGAALRMRRLVPRTTSDVDVLAVIGADDRPAAPDLTELKPHIAKVARDFGIPTDWLNDDVALQWRVGMPPDLLEDVKWLQFDTLRIGLAGRPLLIALKLFATADSSHESVHCQDLIAISPTTEELTKAKQWVVTQDGNELWESIIDEVITHVETHRLP